MKKKISKFIDSGKPTLGNKSIYAFPVPMDPHKENHVKEGWAAEISKKLKKKKPFKIIKKQKQSASLPAWAQKSFKVNEDILKVFTQKKKEIKKNSVIQNMIKRKTMFIPTAVDMNFTKPYQKKTKVTLAMRRKQRNKGEISEKEYYDLIRNVPDWIKTHEKPVYLPRARRGKRIKGDPNIHVMKPKKK